MKRTRIIIDTNLFISYALSNLKGKLTDILINDQIDIITSIEQKEELTEVIYREKFFYTVSSEIKKELLILFDAATIEIAVTSSVKFCRDAKDNYLLGLALDTKADFLITGDKDLLEIKKFEETTICTLSELVENYL